MDIEDPQSELRAPIHGGNSGVLLRYLVQGPPGGHPGRFPLPDHIQYGGGCSDS